MAHSRMRSWRSGAEAGWAPIRGTLRTWTLIPLVCDPHGHRAQSRRERARGGWGGNKDGASAERKTPMSPRISQAASQWVSNSSPGWAFRVQPAWRGFLASPAWSCKPDRATEAVGSREPGLERRGRGQLLALIDKRQVRWRLLQAPAGRKGDATADDPPHLAPDWRSSAAWCRRTFGKWSTLQIRTDGGLVSRVSAS